MKQVAVTVALLAVTGTPAYAQQPDFAQARDQAVQILQSLIRLDTSNPPGHETIAAQYLKTLLEQQGIPAKIYEMVEGRGNVVARIKGNGSKQPLLLMGHLDVVGVERDNWSVDPFAGVIQDGYLWGRGSQDDKGMTAVALQVVLMLERQNVELDRDIIFLAEAGEEGTPEVGINYMVDQHWDDIAAEFALNEGGRIWAENGRVGSVAVATTEKVPRRMRLVARGTSGHGSRPRPDNPIVHLAAAVAKFGAWQPQMRLNENTSEYFKRMAEISPADEAFLYRHLEDPDLTEMVQEKLRLTDIEANSMIRTSISPNIIDGGFRSNVIPAEAVATLDVRALPDEDIPQLIAQMNALIDDSLVEVVPPSNRGRPVSPPSRLDTDMFRAIEQVQARVFPDAVTLPTMLTGATDSAQLRAKGVQAYGIGAVIDQEIGSLAHGNDERLSVEGIGQFVEFLYNVVLEVAASK